MQEMTLAGIPVVYYFILLAFLITKIPVVGKFFNIMNTAIHELGHALFSLLDGKVLKIELFNTSEGVTVTKSRSKFNTFLVALSGYPFASFMAWICFYLLGHQFAKELIIGLSALFLLMLILWIRNRYGIIWVILFCLINFGVLYYNKPQITELVALFYSAVILTESVFSSLTILYLSITNPKQAGDTTVLKKITGIPAFFWGLLFSGFSGFMTYLIIVHFPWFF